jgi:L-alanine-DL-glutamate epimerase-like enolase superfamily enzyme
LIVVEVAAGGERGLGYTYAEAAVARIIADKLAPLLRGRDAADIEALWSAMFAALRNLGRAGATSMAVSAVDVALWDLKAHHAGVPLVKLLGQVREAMPLYGSGGFTSYSDAQLTQQFEGWARQGFTRFKMKIGREPARDRHRVRVAREAIGAAAELFVDANSAYTRAQALENAQAFANEVGIRWLEEPLEPWDFEGLHFLRGRMPQQVEIAEGEYGYDLPYFRRLLEAEAADVVQADATRCGGITGFLKVAALCEAWARPLSSHCAPLLHLPLGCAVLPFRHAEYFHDHARIERELFEGFPPCEGSVLRPNLSAPGFGVAFKWQDAERYTV